MFLVRLLNCQNRKTAILSMIHPSTKFQNKPTMMCRFILDMVPSYKIFGKVKLQHGRQNIITLTYSRDDWCKNDDKSMNFCTNA